MFVYVLCGLAVGRVVTATFGTTRYLNFNLLLNGSLESFLGTIFPLRYEWGVYDLTFYFFGSNGVVQ